MTNLENLINRRLLEQIELAGGLSPNQFGFGKGQSTVNANDKMINIITVDRHNCCAIISGDAKNAFNAADWNIILRKLSDYLVNIISDYFTNR